MDGNPLRIAGKTYASGVGVHAVSRIRVKLDGQAEQFHAMVGVDDEKEIGSVNFQVLVDGKPVWHSGLMNKGDAAKAVVVRLRQRKIARTGG